MMNNKKIIYRSFFIALVICGLMIGSMSFAKEGPEKEKENGRLAKVMAYDPAIFACLNINNLWMWDRKDGKSNHSANGADGVHYPRGTTHVIYQDGLVWGARAYTDAALTQPAPFDQEIRVMGVTYGTGCVEGWINGEGATAERVQADDPRARMYRLRRDWQETFKDADGNFTDAAKQDASDSYEVPLTDVTDVMMNLLYDEFTWNWENWPVDLGAPYIERNGQPGYQKPPAFGPDFNVDSLITQNYDEPGLAGADPNSPADMVLWNVYNDLYRSLRFGSEPTGMECQSTVWGYKRSDALGNMYFRKLRMINKGGVEIDAAGNKGSFWLDSCYVVQWSDPDLGNAGDDLVGCDTVLSIGYVYNGNAVDDLYKEFNLPPPAAGYDYLQGPALPSPGDVAVFDLKYKQDFKNLGMTGFSYFSAGSPYSDPSNSTYLTGAIRWYKMMRGFAPLDGPDVPYRQPPGVVPGPFPLAGDPVLGTGHVDGKGEEWSFVPGDRRLLVITGPWTMAPGDTQEVVTALVAGLGADRLSSVSVMKFNDEFAQNTYDALFQVPSPPADPVVTVSAKNEEILLEWGSDVTSVKATEETVVNPGEYTFEGYNVYQVPSAGSTKRDAKLIATYDVVNEFTVVLDRNFDPSSGQVLELPVHFGSNSGVLRQFTFDRDYIADFDKITNGKEYYLAVTAYSVAKQPVLPKALESKFNVMTVMAQVPFGVEFTNVAGDTIAAEHTAGTSDGWAYPVVTDPAKLNGHTYEVTFTDVDADGNTEWTLTDKTTNTVKISQNTDQTGGTEGYFSDGFQLRVLGAPLSFKNFIVTAHAGGPQDPPLQGSQDWGGFPTEYTGRVNQSNGTGWFFSAGGASNNAYSTFLSRVIRGSGWDYLIPDDFEYRFVGMGTGNYIWSAYNTGALIEVPFEFWDVTRNIKMVCWTYDVDGDDIWGLRPVDHPGSGGSNDPYTDWVYPHLPLNDADNMGTAGYDAWLAAAQADPNYANSSGNDVGPEIMGRNVWFSWNGGDVSDGTLDAVAVKEIETGSIWKLVTTKPNQVNDVFTFTTPAPASDLALQKASAENVGVFPNPYYAFNALEVNRLVRFVTFNNLPPKANIRIFNLAGHLVRVIEKDDATQFAKWDLMNQSLVPVASGVYIAYVDMPDVGVEKTLKLVIVQEAEVLPVY